MQFFKKFFTAISRIFFQNLALPYMGKTGLRIFFVKPENPDTTCDIYNKTGAEQIGIEYAKDLYNFGHILIDEKTLQFSIYAIFYI